MTRVVVGGEGLRGFDASAHADSYVKLLFVGQGEQAPRMRSYTVRAFDAGTLELTLDFVVHGDAGIAGPWASRAVPGDEVQLLGPGGGYTPDPTATSHLLVGDASALPAIAVALERMPADAQGHVVVEVPGPAHELTLAAPMGIRIDWVHQGVERPGARLVEAVRALPWQEGDVQAFVHGEAGAVKQLRRYLRIERGMGLDRLSISGYWRLGVDDEGWRASKREWTVDVEAAERALPV
jgi:NADPH-dependent ferric siderophore reductase